jgi:hypothetical protein
LKAIKEAAKQQEWASDKAIMEEYAAQMEKQEAARRAQVGGAAEGNGCCCAMHTARQAHRQAVPCSDCCNGNNTSERWAKFLRESMVSCSVGLALMCSSVVLLLLLVRAG